MDEQTLTQQLNVANQQLAEARAAYTAEKARSDQWKRMAETLNTNLSVAQDRILELEAKLQG